MHFLPLVSKKTLQLSFLKWLAEANMLQIIMNQQSVYYAHVVHDLWGHKVSRKVFHKVNLAVAAGKCSAHSCRRLLFSHKFRGLQRHVDWSDRHEWKKGAELNLREGHEGVSVPWTRLNLLTSPPCTHTQATAGIDPKPSLIPKQR